MLLHKKIFLVSILLNCLLHGMAIASSLNSISVQNNTNQSTVTLYCSAFPSYMIYSLNNPERIVIDLSKISKTYKKNMLPMGFNGENIVKCIRMSVPIRKQSIRIVCDLNCSAYIKSVTQKKIGKNYHIILTMVKKSVTSFNSDVSNVYSLSYLKECEFFEKRMINNLKKIAKTQFNQQLNIFSNQKRQDNNNILDNSVVVIAIDAGHGGHDPGATGCHGIFEKNITLSIAKKLKNLLNADLMFKPIMIRDGDYFLSVMERSELARKKKANMLISIHADSAVNSKVKGASVWILSDRRAKIEAAHWLQSKEKHAELLGGIRDILINNHTNDPYFNHLVLDLQFGYAQRVGYDIAMQVLHSLKSVSVLHKSVPEYSGFGVLRSPDIPSILVEIGFISNFREEYLLTTNEYQEKIAQALYKGLRLYFLNELAKNRDHL